MYEIRRDFRIIQSDAMVPTPLAVAPAYTGPGNIVAGATAWYGLRAYSSAQCGGTTKAIRIVKTSDGSAPLDINILTTGALDVATINALGYGVSVTTLYDQTAGGKDLTQATLAGMPILNLSGIGSLPMLDFTVTSQMSLRNATGLGAIAQPFTISTVFRRASSSAVYENYFCDSALNGLLGDTAANGALVYVGGGVTPLSVADAAFHALQAIAKDTGGNSYYYLDGVNTPASLGATTGWASGQIYLGNNGTRPVPLSKIGEVGIWPADFTAGNSSSVNLNQHAYWGF